MRHTIKLQHARTPIRNGVRRVVEAVLMFLWGGSPQHYFPEAHYMRGRGPKWAEKHGALPEDSSRVRASNPTNEKRNAGT
jgi:hypothetical protein